MATTVSPQGILSFDASDYSAQTMSAINASNNAVKIALETQKHLVSARIANANRALKRRFLENQILTDDLNRQVLQRKIKKAKDTEDVLDKIYGTKTPPTSPPTSPPTTSRVNPEDPGIGGSGGSGGYRFPGTTTLMNIAALGGASSPQASGEGPPDLHRQLHNRGLKALEDKHESDRAFRADPEGLFESSPHPDPKPNYKDVTGKYPPESGRQVAEGEGYTQPWQKKVADNPWQKKVADKKNDPKSSQYWSDSGSSSYQEMFSEMYDGPSSAKELGLTESVSDSFIKIIDEVFPKEGELPSDASSETFIRKIATAMGMDIAWSDVPEAAPEERNKLYNEIKSKFLVSSLDAKRDMLNHEALISKNTDDLVELRYPQDSLITDKNPIALNILENISSPRRPGDRLRKIHRDPEGNWTAISPEDITASPGDIGEDLSVKEIEEHHIKLEKSGLDPRDIPITSNYSDPSRKPVNTLFRMVNYNAKEMDRIETFLKGDITPQHREIASGLLRSKQEFQLELEKGIEEIKTSAVRRAREELIIDSLRDSTISEDDRKYIEEESVNRTTSNYFTKSLTNWFTSFDDAKRRNNELQKYVIGTSKWGYGKDTVKVDFNEIVSDGRWSLINDLFQKFKTSHHAVFDSKKDNKLAYMIFKHHLYATTNFNLTPDKYLNSVKRFEYRGHDLVPLDKNTNTVEDSEAYLSLINNLTSKEFIQNSIRTDRRREQVHN